MSGTKKGIRYKEYKTPWMTVKSRQNRFRSALGNKDRFKITAYLLKEKISD